MFGNDKEKMTIEQKQEIEVNKFLNRYHLEDLNPNDLLLVKNIARDMMGSGTLRLGMALTFAKSEEQLKVNYLSTLVEQNWIMINQLSRIENKINK